MNKIKSYLGDFGMSDSDIAKYVKCLSEKTKKSLTYTENRLAETLEMVVDNSIQIFEQNTGLSLREYQIAAVKHMTVDRGMIAAFDVGTGKTITAVCTVYVLSKLSDFLNLELNFLFITPASLIDNMKNALKKFGVDINNPRFKFYSFTKYSRDIVKHLNPEDPFSMPNPKRTVLVIDEAHNLKKSNMVLIPGVIRPKAANRRPSQGDNAHAYGHRCAKVLALTATPVYNATHDPFMIAMQVAGKQVTAHYPGDGQGVVNPLKNRIMFVKADKENFPRREDYYHFIYMTPEYLKAYFLLEESIYNNTNPDAEDVVNAFMGKLRQAANTLPDQECMKCNVTMDIIKNATPTKTPDGKTIGAKILIYSTFLDSGIEPIKAMLKGTKDKLYVISGKTKISLRQKYTDEYNNNTQKSIAIITKAGSEGLDFRGITDVILIEPVFNVASETQTTGRGIRFRSHKHLLDKYQNVRIHHLAVVKPFTDKKILEDLRYPAHYNYKSTVLHGEYRKETAQEEEHAKYVFGYKLKDMKKSLAFNSADVYMIRHMMEKQETLDKMDDELKENEIPH